MANEVKKLVRQRVRWPGWRVEEPSKGFVVYLPDKDVAPVTIHTIESDRRAIANAIERLRQRGAPR
jgi:hypothetical protein